MKEKQSSTEAEKSREKRLRRMRAYYQKNKNKWQAYKRMPLTQLPEGEREKRRRKNHAHYRRHYLANREAILSRTRTYHQSDVSRWAAYQAAWYQQNRPAVADRRRRHYHEVATPRLKAAKANAEFVSIRQAVELLGANLSAFRRWVYEGRIPATRTPGGHYLLRRKFVEDIKAQCQHFPTKHRKNLGLNRQGGVK